MTPEELQLLEELAEDRGFALCILDNGELTGDTRIALYDRACGSTIDGVDIIPLREAEEAIRERS